MNNNFKFNSYKGINKVLLLIQKQNLKKFEEANQHYNAILKNYSNLAKQLQLKDSLEICILFTYLLWNGYFSVNGENVYSNYNLLSKSGIFGFDVMNGRGVCVNHSAMLRDFLIECGYKSSTLANEFDVNFEAERVSNIRRRLEPLMPSSQIKSFFISPIQNLLGNHEFNLIKEDNSFYIYDSTNILLLNLRNFNTAKIVNGKGTFKLKIGISLGNNLADESREILKELGNFKRFKPVYDKAQFIETFQELTNKFRSKRGLFNYFYELSYNDIEFVANTVNEEVKKR